jgi:hypothetical protein
MLLTRAGALGIGVDFNVIDGFVTSPKVGITA